MVIFFETAIPIIGSNIHVSFLLTDQEKQKMAFE